MKIRREYYSKLKQLPLSKVKTIQDINFRLPAGTKELMMDEIRKLQKLIILKFSSKKKTREPTPSLLDQIGMRLI